MGIAILVLQIVSLALGILGTRNGAVITQDGMYGDANSAWNWAATILPIIGSAGAAVAAWFMKGGHSELMQSLIAYLLNRSDKAALRRFVQAAVDELIVAFKESPEIVKILSDLSNAIIPQLLSKPKV